MTAPFLVAALTLLSPMAGDGQGDGRVIVLGFDGADARLTRQFMDEGRLPNLSRLRDTGTFLPLGTALPPQSPVSWAVLNTATNPAKTGVFGFMKRSLPYPLPAIGFYDTKPRAVPAAELFPGWLLGGARLAVIAGALVFLVLLALLKGLLKLPMGAALGIGAALGGGAGYAAWKVSGDIPRSVPATQQSMVQGVPFWNDLGAAGVDSVVIGAHTVFPVKEAAGTRVLAGLGVPDARGVYGDWFIYTTDDLEFDGPPKGRSTGTAGRVFRVYEEEGVVDTHLFGPGDFKALQDAEAELARVEADLKAAGFDEVGALESAKSEWKDRIQAIKAKPLATPMKIERLGAGGGVAVTVGGTTVDLGLGDWTPFVPVEFIAAPMWTIHALARIKLVALEPHLQLFVEPLQLDPSNPPPHNAICWPPDFSRQLADAVGPFETVGWACDTHPLKDDEITDATFLEDIEFTLQWRERILDHFLGTDDPWQFFMETFSTTDRVCHMGMRHFDPDHPRFDEALAHSETTFFGETIRLRDAVPAIYAQMDRIVGKTLDAMRAGDRLMIVSDHGFSSIHRRVNLNNWLWENGYLAVKEDYSSTGALQYVDWANTTAYSVGLGKIFLNLKGREFKGMRGFTATVEPAEAGELLDRIALDLKGLTDPGRDGAKVIREVYRRDQVFDGPLQDHAADLFVGFEDHYLGSGSTGGIRIERGPDGGIVSKGMIRDETSNWGGDHTCVDPSVVEGIFFSNVKIADESVELRHVGPTALEWMGVPVPARMDLGPLRTRE